MSGREFSLCLMLNQFVNSDNGNKHANLAQLKNKFNIILNLEGMYAVPVEPHTVERDLLNKVTAFREIAFDLMYEKIEWNNANLRLILSKANDITRYR